MISNNMTGIRSDDEFLSFIQQDKVKTAVVQFASSWCQKCAEFFPTWYRMSKEYPQHRYAVAQVDTMNDTVKSIRYSPTFRFYRNGKVVDQVLGKEQQKLADHLWLHAD